MYIHVGTYRIAKKLQAFRNDYCLSCEARRVSFGERSFEVVHVFFIPLVPLGWRTRWTCDRCGSDPHERVRSSPVILGAGAVLAAFTGVVFWLLPDKSADMSAIWLWALRLGMPLAAVLMFAYAFWGPKPEGLKELLKGVRPYEDDHCPACYGPMYSVPVRHCPSCKVQCLRLGEKPRKNLMI